MLITLKRITKKKGTFHSLLGVDKDSVFDGKSKHSLIDFCLSLSSNKTLLVCTRKEAALLLETKLLPDVKIQILELKLPFLSTIRYKEDSRKNFTQLTHWANKFQNFVAPGFFSALQTTYHRKLLNKIPKKYDVDNYFRFAPCSSLQEAYVLKEQRKDRTIIALDFNSMFGWALEGPFSNPRNLEFKSINMEMKAGQKLDLGAYRVLLCGADEFVKRFFPLSTFRVGRHFYPELTDKDVWTGWLTKTELNFYSRHFKKIFLYEGVLSNDSINHPFAKICNRLYKQRLHFKAQNNKNYANLCKLIIASLHAIPAPTTYVKKTFTNVNELQNFLVNRLGLEEIGGAEHISRLLPYLNFERNFPFRFNRIRKSNKKTKEILTTLNVREKNVEASIFCLYSEVLGKVRTKLLETIEYISSFQDSEICYVNIDSIHVSLPRNEKQNFLKFIKPILGQEMGKLKIEAEASQGIWLAPGIYSLKGQEKIIVKKIQGVSCNWKPENSFNQRVYLNSISTTGLELPLYTKISLSKVLRLKNELDRTTDDNFVRFKRFSFTELNDPMLLEEKLKKMREKETPLLLTEWELFHKV